MEEIKQKWYIGRWKINYGDPADYFDTTMDIESIQDGFIIGTTKDLCYTAIPISSVMNMEKI